MSNKELHIEEKSIKLESFTVHEIYFNISDLVTDSDEIPLDFLLTPSMHLPEDEERLFYGIKFDVTISKRNSKSPMTKLTALGEFSYQGIKDDILNSDYVLSQSPAIVYPYVRTFVSNLFLSCGLQPYMLPLVNFTITRSE